MIKSVGKVSQPGGCTARFTECAYPDGICTSPDFCQDMIHYRSDGYRYQCECPHGHGGPHQACVGEVNQGGIVISWADCR